MRKLIFILLFSVFSAYGQEATTENLVFITIDGLRWQELFGGADAQLISKKKYVSDIGELKQLFWSKDAHIRREKLFPFFWSVMAGEGQLFGNRNYGNYMNLKNSKRFSYPGYSEILCGFEDDNRINSNDKVNNANKTFLEFLNRRDAFKGKVVAFGSWDVFPYIINEERSGIYVNAGFESPDTQISNDAERMISKIQEEIRGPWETVRLDPFTHHYAMEYLKKNEPRVIYIAYGETDDWAHDGRYDEYLKSAYQTDQYIKQIWEFIQLTPAYKNKTTMIITTDHGRGLKKEWKHHGSSIKTSGEVWFAIIGPEIEPLGELKIKNQYYSDQLAKTSVYLLGIDYVNDRPVGAIIPSLKQKTD